MKRFIILVLMALTLDAKIVVVANKNSPLSYLPKEVVQYLYLAKINEYDQIRIEPIVSKDEELHNQFCDKILCKTVSQYNSYWARLVFTGKKPIAKRYELEDVIKKLQNPDTIAYIDKKDLKDEWKIVYEEN